MPVNIDFSTAEGSEFKLLEPGDYPCTIYEVTLSDKEGPSGFKYITIVYQLTDGSKQRLWDNLSLSPKALYRLKTLLQRLGYSEAELAGALDLDEKELLGREVVCRVIMDKWEGKDTNRVAEVFLPGQVPTASATAAGGGWG